MDQAPDAFVLKFTYQPAQKKLFHYVSHNGQMYMELKAPQNLEVGGQRSGKTTSKLVFGVENYCLKYSHCDMLVLRRTFSELDSGAIQDFKNYFPPDSGLYTFNQSTRVAIFVNGSRLVFAGCVRGGSLIDTDRGLVPIEHVTTEDQVLTRKGYRRVLWSGPTGVKPVISLGTLEVTAEHRVYCDGEFIPAQEIVCRRDSGKTARLLTPRFSEVDARMLPTATTYAASNGMPVPVYDLTVEGEHEYFADGILVHNCVNNQERDIEKYLGQAYPFILVDECGQFSDNAWNLLYARNLVNVQCERDAFGNLPTPAIVGCTNPIGAFWTFYHTKFVKKEPWERSEGMRQTKDGRWFVERAGEWVCVYDPKDYAYNHSTVLDNPEYIKRHPGIIAHLKALPEAMMKKYLYGYMDTVDGQYFDCFSDEYHVVDLREDPEAILWQDWQPVWVGHDWGVGHWSAAYFFTKALVKNPVGNDYKLKTVCFQEIAPEETGHTNVELADMLSAKAHYPKLPDSHSQFDRISGKRCKVSAIYFSHEKFSRVMERHSPADEYSRLLRERGLPPVSRATMDRIGSAGFMYNELKLGRLVILRTCPGIILSIPALQRNRDNLDDVLKVDTKSDDRYDAFRYGLYGGLSTKMKPQAEKDREYADTLEPMARHFHLLKTSQNRSDASTPFVQAEEPVWKTGI